MKKQAMTVEEAGRKGGQATLANNGIEFYKENSMKGVMARKANRARIAAEKKLEESAATPTDL